MIIRKSKNQKSSQLRTTPYLLRTKAGFALVEIVVASVIVAVSLFGLLATAQHFLQLSRETNRNVQANYLLKEGMEALRSMRDDNYSTHIGVLAVGTTYYLYWNGSAWQSTTTAQSVGEFTRSFTTESVSRDTNDDIVTSGGSVDTHTKKLNVTVSWTNSGVGTTSRAASSYLTNYFR